MRLLASVLLLCTASAVRAQVPDIVGTWKFNAAASKLPAGAPPQSDVRRYSLMPDGTLVGLAVIVDAHGVPTFLQFAARPDGKDYPEFDSGTAAQYLKDGSPPPRTYSEKPVDARTVEWVDKRNGTIVGRGRKWVSADGKTLSFTSEGSGADGRRVEYLFVFDRTGS